MVVCRKTDPPNGGTASVGVNTRNHFEYRLRLRRRLDKVGYLRSTDNL